MPELPEVETVIRSLSSKIKGRTFESSNLIFDKIVKHGSLSTIEGKTIEDLTRRGKFIIFELSEGCHMIAHLRMEGKLFFHQTREEPTKHTTCVFSFTDGSQLHFLDVRKFGCLYVYKEEESPDCLKDLGYEANKLTPDEARILLDESKDAPLKELLLDQTKIAGIGNIYADEIAFRIKANPFASISTIDRDGLPDELSRSCQSILEKAIENHGSTIKSFMVAEGVHGNNQDSLMVYGRQNLPCLVCCTKIMKRDFRGRGTSYCPRCQNVPHIIGVTGGMASGKSTFSKYLADELDATHLDCDKLVFEIYANKTLSRPLRSKYPDLFENDSIDKKNLTRMLTEDRKNRRSFLALLYSILKEHIVNDILNKNPTKSYVIEAALLFDARLDSLCDKIVMMRTAKFEEHLIDRGEKDIEKRRKLASTNDWAKYIDSCNNTIESDGSLDELKDKAIDLANKLN